MWAIANVSTPIDDTAGGPPGPDTPGGRIKDRREALGLGQAALANHIGVNRSQVSVWENGHQLPGGANLVRLARVLEVTSEWILHGSEGGHLVVRETGEIYLDPRPDSEGTPAEQLMAFLGLRVGMRRLAGELTGKDLVATAYTLARAEGFSAEEFKKLDAWRDQILKAEGRGGG